MTASSAVVLSNLAYLIGAVVLATIGGLIVWWRHRQPRSIQSNVQSFQRGLRALAPDASRSASIRAIRPASSAAPQVQRELDPAGTVTLTASAETAGAIPPAPDDDPAGGPPVRANGRQPAGRSNGSVDRSGPPDDPAAGGLDDSLPDLGDRPSVFPPPGSALPAGANGPRPETPDLGDRPGVLPPPGSALPAGANGPRPESPDLGDRPSAFPPPGPGQPDGANGPRPESPDLADSASGLPPVDPARPKSTPDLPPMDLDLPGGTVGPPPVSPDPPEPSFLLSIDDAGSARRVAGRAGVEAG